MNITEIKAMTDEELRIKVAELLGVMPPSVACYGMSEVPNYPADLNACHEMEKALLGDNWHDYAALLKSTAQFRWHATARQRCEAFVATMEVT